MVGGLSILALVFLVWTYVMVCTAIARGQVFRSWKIGPVVLLCYLLGLAYLWILAAIIYYLRSEIDHWPFSLGVFLLPIAGLFAVAVVTSGFDGRGSSPDGLPKPERPIALDPPNNDVRAPRRVEPTVGAKEPNATKAARVRDQSAFERSATSLGDLFRGVALRNTHFSGAVLELTIQDDWVGLSQLSPQKRLHRLERGEHGLTGTSRFQVGETVSLVETQVAGAETFPVALPDDVLEVFLQRLSSCPVEFGSYRPTRTHTDDYPTRKVTVLVASEVRHFCLSGSKVAMISKSSTITVMTESQSGQPWQVELDGLHWTIPDDGPTQALASIEKHLNPGLFAEMMRIAEEAPRPAVDVDIPRTPGDTRL